MNVAKAIEGIPVVQSTTERGVLFAIPATDQRVFNKSTGNIERWNGASWVPDFTSNGGIEISVDNAPFSAVGDAVADDSAAIAAAITAAKAVAGKVKFGPKKYRVIAGFIQSVAYQDVVLEGTGSSRENVNDQGTEIILDSTDPASFFYSHAARHHLYVRDITFKCAQFVKDRAFFKFTTTNFHHFQNVNFESVERPIVYKAGSYFQNASFKDVQFRNSGTLHSETTALVGTLLRLDNVNHEGSTPDNTPKVICNLQGVRVIIAETFLLEGTVPAAGWIGLNLDLGAATAGITIDHATVMNGFWCEVAGTALANTVRASGVVAEFTMAQSIVSSTTSSMLLDKGSIVTIRNTALSGSSNDFNSIATFADVYSRLIFDSCQLREVQAVTSPQIAFNRCVSVRDSSALVLLMPTSTIDNEILYEWNGGKLNNRLFVTHPAQASFAHLRTIITDATYGRLININKNGQTWAQWILTVACPTEWSNMILRVQLYAKFRTRVGGTQSLNCSGAVTPALVAQVTEEAFAWYHLAVRIPAGGGTINFQNNVAGGGTVANDIQIAAMRVSLGEGYGRFPSLDKPLHVEFEDTAAPTTGTWAVSDRAKNSVQTVGQPKAWVCTVAGTPGTWVSEGNL